MKTITLVFSVILVIASTTNSFAQSVENPTRKGRIIGDIGFGFSRGKASISNASLSGFYLIRDKNIFSDTRIGYTLIKNLSVGIRMSVNSRKSAIAYPDPYNLGSIYEQEDQVNWRFFAAFTRYYFLKNQFKPFIEVGGGLALQKTESISSAGRDYYLNGSGGIIVLGAGVSYFINDHVGFELYYNYSSSSFSQSGYGNDFGFPYEIAYEETESSSNVKAGVLFILGK